MELGQRLAEPSRQTGDLRRPVRAAYAAGTWVVVFFAFHVYWYLGGSFGHTDPLPGVPDSPAGWVFLVVVTAAFPVGAWVCLDIAREWSRGRLRSVIVTLVWLGCAVLVVRGGAGIIDDLTRSVGLLPNGITGLSLEQTMGTADPSTYARWTSRATDAYFLAGGILFGVLGRRCAGSAVPPSGAGR